MFSTCICLFRIAQSAKPNNVEPKTASNFLTSEKEALEGEQRMSGTVYARYARSLAG